MQGNPSFRGIEIAESGADTVPDHGSRVDRRLSGDGEPIVDPIVDLITDP
jgi:hypothetical protein